MGKWSWTSARQYAEYTGLDVQYIRRLIRQGIIPALSMPGGHYKIDIGCADAALEAYMRQPKPQARKEKEVVPKVSNFREALKALI